MTIAKNENQVVLFNRLRGAWNIISKYILSSQPFESVRAYTRSELASTSTMTADMLWMDWIETSHDLDISTEAFSLPLNYSNEYCFTSFYPGGLFGCAGFQLVIPRGQGMQTHHDHKTFLLTGRTTEIRIWRHFCWSAFFAMAVWNSVKVDRKVHLECKLRFPCVQFMFRQIYRTYLSGNIEARYWVFLAKSWRLANVKSSDQNSASCVRTGSCPLWRGGRRFLFNIINRSCCREVTPIRSGSEINEVLSNHVLLVTDFTA